MMRCHFALILEASSGLVTMEGVVRLITMMTLLLALFHGEVVGTRNVPA